MIRHDEFEIEACTELGWDPASVLEFFDNYFTMQVKCNKQVFYLCPLCRGYHFHAIPDFEWRV